VGIASRDVVVDRSIGAGRERDGARPVVLRRHDGDPRPDLQSQESGLRAAEARQEARGAPELTSQKERGPRRKRPARTPAAREKAFPFQPGVELDAMTNRPRSALGKHEDDRLRPGGLDEPGDRTVARRIDRSQCVVPGARGIVGIGPEPVLRARHVRKLRQGEPPRPALEEMDEDVGSPVDLAGKDGGPVALRTRHRVDRPRTEPLAQRGVERGRFHVSPLKIRRSATRDHETGGRLGTAGHGQIEDSRGDARLFKDAPDRRNGKVLGRDFAECPAPIALDAREDAMRSGRSPGHDGRPQRL
jgi:hypothetical protein